MEEEIRSVLTVNLINKIGKANLEEVFNCNVIGLLFSAHWCPPCRVFTPKLIQAYLDLNQDQKQFEIIYCTQDRDEESFLEYLEEMPWPGVGFAEFESICDLADKFEIIGVPTLIVLNDKLQVLDNDGRTTFYQMGPEKALSHWKELARVKAEGGAAEVPEEAKEGEKEE
jgi:nucleoredoxin